MDSALLIHRLHFAFTVTFHYLFPQLTMGLAPLIVVLKTLGLRRNDETYNRAARFWARIFGINFVLGVVTGIPMEFQFGTNWSHFSRFAGGVIGQTLAMEGMFAFFLESAFLGLFLYGEKRLGPRGHWWSAVAVFFGSWLSGFFIIATDAWMQHPVGYFKAGDGSVQLASFWDLVLNPWAWWQYAHNMSGAVITGSFVMASVGAFYFLWGKFEEYGRIFVRVGVIAALIFSALQLFPTGDGQGRLIAENQPVTLAAMEALFESQPGAPIVLIGQPNVDERKIDNPLVVPERAELSDLPRMEGGSERAERFPARSMADEYRIALFQLSHHGGTGNALHRHRVGGRVVVVAREIVFESLDAVDSLLALPFPYIANTAGWITAELGRQPWLVYALMRTADGYSKTVSAGNGIFTLLGFMGMYTVLGILFLFLVRREIEQGPEAEGAAH